ncbi:MAG: DUF2750 domain-containing protein [Pseudomonadota bacterium]
MSVKQKSPEAMQQKRFVRRLANAKRMFVVSGENGLARVPSQKQSGRDVVFAWTERKEAERWADCLATNPRIKELVLAEVLADFFPALHEHQRLVATDWTADEIEPETEPLALGEQVRLETANGFMQRVAASGNVYILENSFGPALLVSSSGQDQLFLPCWSQREVAESRLEGPWADHMVMRIPLANFVKITLPWLTEQGHRVAPEHVPGSAALELEPATIEAHIHEQASLVEEAQSVHPTSVKRKIAAA